MAKKLVTSYTFDASERTITSDDFTSLEKIQLITNVTDQIIIYNFADQAKGGTLATTTLTLEYDTTTMADGDKLQIFVDDATVVQPVSGTVTAELSATDNAVLDAIVAAQLPDGHNVTVDNASLAVTGTFWQATQPVSGSVTVDMGANNDVTVTSGSITANAGTNLNTSALATEAGNLASIKAKTDNIPALGQALAAASVPVILPSATITTLTPPAAITGFALAANQLPDGHNVTVDNPEAIGGGTQYTEGDVDATITGTATLVEGAANALAVLTQPLTDTQLRATPVPISGSITADLGANNDVTVTSGSITATQATGTNLHVVVDSAPTTAVTGTFYQATQPISGTVTADLGATDNAVLDAIAASTAAIETAVEGTLTVTGGGGGTEYTEGDIDATITGSVGLMEVADNTVQPIQGTVAGGLLVNLGSNNDVTVTGSVTADLGANNDVTVTGTVDLGATDNAVLDAIESDTTTIAGDTTSIDGKLPALGQALAAASIPVILPAATITTLTPPAAITGFATEAKQLADGHSVALSATDNAVLDQIELNTDPLLVVGGGTEATAIRVTIANNSTGVVSVDDNGGALTVDGTVTAELSATDNAVLDTIDAVLDTINAKLVTGTDIGDVTINNSTGAAAVNIQDGGNTITVDGTVTANLGATDNAVLDDIAAKLGTIDTDTGNITTAVQLIDNAISGSEMQVDVVAALPTGTNAIGRVGHDVTGVGHGVKTVTTAGTDVALAASTACKKVDIQAQTDNTSLISVGGSGVDATIATGTGIVLYPGDVYSLEIDNLADIYIDSLVNGEGVRFTYYT